MSESSFVCSLLSTTISFPWKSGNRVRYATELKITHNRVDIVYFEESNCGQIKSVIAVEAKIKDWRKALQQAYRDKLFANRAYVALPAQYAASAITNISEFRRASVGLVVLDGNVAKIYHHPKMNTKVSAFHAERARGSLAAMALADERVDQPMYRGAGYSLALAA